LALVLEKSARLRWEPIETNRRIAELDEPIVARINAVQDKYPHRKP
jgi:hypothetical protein